jgi:hypothetical protein
MHCRYSHVNVLSSLSQNYVRLEHNTAASSTPATSKHHRTVIRDDAQDKTLVFIHSKWTPFTDIYKKSARVGLLF